MLDLAAAGRCVVDVEAFALAEVAQAWTRAGAGPDGRVVVLPGDDQGEVSRRASR